MYNIVLYFNIKLTKRDWYIYRMRGKTEQTLNPVLENMHQKKIEVSNLDTSIKSP